MVLIPFDDYKLQVADSLTGLTVHECFWLLRPQNLQIAAKVSS